MMKTHRRNQISQVLLLTVTGLAVAGTALAAEGENSDLTTQSNPIELVEVALEAPDALEPLAAASGHAPRQHDFANLVEASSPHDAVSVNANAPLYTLYTSGTTGQPKGILRDNSHAVALQWTTFLI